MFIESIETLVGLAVMWVLGYWYGISSKRNTEVGYYITGTMERVVLAKLPSDDAFRLYTTLCRDVKTKSYYIRSINDD